MNRLLWWKTIRPSQAEMACHHAERKKISLYSLTVTTTWDCGQLLALSTTSNSLVTPCMGCCDEKLSVPAKQRWLAIMLNGRKSVCILWLWRPLEIAGSSLLYQQLVTVWWLHAWVAVMKNYPSQPSRDGLPSCWTEENQFVFSDCDYHLRDCVQLLALSTTSSSLVTPCMGCCDEKLSVPAKQRWLAIMLNGRKSVCILWLWRPLEIVCSSLLYQQLVTVWWLHAWVAVMKNYPSQPSRDTLPSRLTYRHRGGAYFVYHTIYIMWQLHGANKETMNKDTLQINVIQPQIGYINRLF